MVRKQETRDHRKGNCKTEINFSDESNLRIDRPEPSFQIFRLPNTVPPCHCQHHPNHRHLHYHPHHHHRHHEGLGNSSEVVNVRVASEAESGR